MEKQHRAVGEQGVKKKRKDFFHGEVFFLLTRPLMGDTDLLREEKKS